MIIHQARAWRNATSALFPVATAALAAGIFIIDAITTEKLTASVSYVIVVLLAARFTSARGIVLIGIGCVGLTVLAFLLPGVSEPSAPGVKASVSAAVIGLTTFLIAERKRAMEALQESEQQWQEVFEHSPVMYFLVDVRGTVLSVNTFGAEHLGYTVAELVGQPVLDIFFEEEREIVKGYMATCLKELSCSHSWEIRQVRKDGTTLWVRENAKAVRRSGDDVIVLIACEDVTERRHDEQRRDALYAVTRALAEADSLAAATPHLLHAIGANLEWDWGALWSIDRHGAPLHCECLWHRPDVDTEEFDAVSRERSFAEGQGRIGQVWQRASPMWMVDAASEPEFLRASAAARAGLHGALMFPILLDTKALGVVEFFSRAVRERDDEQLAMLSAIGSQIGQFITRRRAEAGLRASEERWRRLFETSAAGMALTRLDGVFTAANPALQQMLGRAEEEIVGHNVLELNHEDERTATAAALAKFRSSLLTERYVEKKYLKKDGSPVWLNITTTLVPASETTDPFLQAVYVDITERRQAEEELHYHVQLLKTVIDNTSSALYILDPAGLGTFVNPSLERITGYRAEELIGQVVHDKIHHTKPDGTPYPERECPLTEAVRRRRVLHGEELFVRKDDTFFPVRYTSSPIFRDGVAVGTVVEFQDLTEPKRSEEALQQAQADLARLNRIMLLGELTASIAHEINQPIAAVITNANAALRWLGTRRLNREEVRQALGRIVRDGNRAGEVIGRVRALVRKVPPRRDCLDINEVVREVIALTQVEVQRNGVSLHTRLADGLPRVPGDRVQLQQVMTNLIVNAVEAMSGVNDGPGALTIVSGRSDAHEVFIAVQDTGAGLDAADLDHLFQSFYTTKPEGMGMGLAISRSIVEAHGGRLSAAPNQPHGAVFRLTLPVEEPSSEGSDRDNMPARDRST